MAGRRVSIPQTRPDAAAGMADGDRRPAGGAGWRKDASLVALIALKLACCGGLLLATGAVSLGGLMAAVDHPAARAGGLAILVLAALAARRLATRRRVRRCRPRPAA